MSDPKMCKLSLLARIKMGKVEEATDMLLMEAPTPEELQAQDDSDGDALFWASCRGYTLIVELVLTLGANVDATSQASGATPLHGAADNGRKDVIRLLLKWGSDVSSRNSFQDTPCHLAAYRGHSKCVAILLRAGAPTHLRNRRLNNVLEEAKYGQLIVRNGDHTLVQHLLYSHEHNGSHSDEHWDERSDRTEPLSYIGRRYCSLNRDYVHSIDTRQDICRKDSCTRREPYTKQKLSDTCTGDH